MRLLRGDKSRAVPRLRAARGEELASRDGEAIRNAGFRRSVMELGEQPDAITTELSPFDREITS
jgi:hypothetical protein